jgi:hypothetical protein
MTFSYAAPAPPAPVSGTRSHLMQDRHQTGVFPESAIKQLKSQPFSGTNEIVANFCDNANKCSCSGLSVDRSSVT